MAVLVMSATSLAHGESTAKVGDVVIALRNSSLNVDGKAVQTVRRGTILSVESVNGPWLWVTQGKSGWIQAGDVIPRDRAVIFFSQEIRSNPRDAEAYRCRGKACLAFGDAQRAVADFNHALMLRPTPLAYADRGMAWSLAGEHDKAVADFSETIRSHAAQQLTNDELGAVYCLRGLARAGKGEWTLAIADFDEAIRLSPGLAFAFNQRGRAWLAQGNSMMKAVADFNEAVRLNPVYDSAYNNRGLAWAAMGEFDSALADFRTAVRLDPDSTFARNTTSRLAAEAMRQDTAQQGANLSRLLDPLESPRNNLALLLATCPDERFRNGKEALENADRLCQLDGHRYAPFLSTLAAACAETGDFAGAVRWQTEALELAPEQKKEESRSRLALYQAGKPYRQASKR
jgi:tetratricopeptide (TPR) repeat protein